MASSNKDCLGCSSVSQGWMNTTTGLCLSCGRFQELVQAAHGDWSVTVSGKYVTVASSPTHSGGCPRAAVGSATVKRRFKNVFTVKGDTWQFFYQEEAPATRLTITTPSGHRKSASLGSATTLPSPSLSSSRQTPSSSSSTSATTSTTSKAIRLEPATGDSLSVIQQAYQDVRGHKKSRLATLLQQHRSVLLNCVDAAGNTLLQAAVTAGSRSAVKLLLSAGFTAIDHRGGNGATAMSTALALGMLDVAHALRPENRAAWQSGATTSFQQLPAVYRTAPDSVLLLGGSPKSSAPARYGLPDNQWSVDDVPQLRCSRSGGAAAVLLSLEVLFTGGHTSTAETQLFSPATRRWQSDAPMHTARAWHTATALGSGDEVLVAGGQSGSVCLESAEIYSAASRAWRPAAAMPCKRYNHVAVLLANGDVLVAGGCSASEPLASALIYSPSRDTWQPVAAMQTARSRPAACLLPAGSVLVVGGHDGNCKLATAELYDPAADRWSPFVPMRIPRSFHTATLVQGRVVVAGGKTLGACTDSTEVYSPDTASWHIAATMPEPRFAHTAVIYRKLTVSSPPTLSSSSSTTKSIQIN